MLQVAVKAMAVSGVSLREVKKLNKPAFFAGLALVHTIFLLYFIVPPDLYTVTAQGVLTNQSVLIMSKQSLLNHGHTSSSSDGVVMTLSSGFESGRLSPFKPFVPVPTSHETRLHSLQRPLQSSRLPLQIYFRSRDNSVLEKRFRELLFVFDKLMTEHGLTYFLYGGTLLGSYRHHGPIPWDDDLDVIVPVLLRPLVKQILSKVSPDFVLNFHQRCYCKLFSSRSDPIPNLPWRWPFLDIFFYDENATHIWDICPYYRDMYRYKKSVVFPLRRRPFLDLSLPAPHDTRAVIAETYNIDECQSSAYIHRWERSRESTTAPCSEIHSLHPFVSRTYMNGGCNETLIHHRNVTKVFFDHGATC